MAYRLSIQTTIIMSTNNNHTTNTLSTSDPRSSTRIRRFDLTEYKTTLSDISNNKNKYIQYISSDYNANISDIMIFVSLILGGITILFRYKYTAWLSLFTCISGYITSTTLYDNRNDSKQSFASISFSLMTLLISYFGVRQNEQYT